MPPLKEEVDTSQYQQQQQQQQALDQISLKQLQDAIPARLFERSALKSTLYLIYNLINVGIVFAVAYNWLNYYCPPILFWPSVVVYWLVQSTVTTGIWVIAHECGHQAYSSNELLNDTLGLILHSALLVPYHAWKISHRIHHRYTSHTGKDTFFIPTTEKEYFKEVDSSLSRTINVIFGNGANKSKKDDDAKTENSDNGHHHHHADGDGLLTDTPIMSTFSNLFHVSAMLIVGWPLYLLMNLKGQKYDGRWVHHFTSDNPIYNGKYRKEILISNLGLLVTLAILSYAAYMTSMKDVLIYYGGPYILVHSWLVLITYLHHTDPRLPHYREGAWTYVKGALATIDRDYGAIINHLHHHIGDTHITHHFFPRIPHYNALEVTQILKPILGSNYKFDDTFFLKSLWHSFTRCHYIPDEGDVVYFKSG